MKVSKPVYVTEYKERLFDKWCRDFDIDCADMTDSQIIACRNYDREGGKCLIGVNRDKKGE